MKHSKLLRRLAVVGTAMVGVFGALQAPASAAPARFGHANFDVNIRATNSAGRVCAGRLDPWETVAWTGFGNTVQTVRTFTCFNGTYTGVITSAINYQTNGWADIQIYLAAYENNSYCSQGSFLSNLGRHGPISGGNNFNSQLRVSGNITQFDFCRAGLSVDMGEGLRF